jgi:hypothetical protein
MICVMDGTLWASSAGTRDLLQIRKSGLNGIFLRAGF